MGLVEAVQKDALVLRLSGNRWLVWQFLGHGEPRSIRSCRPGDLAEHRWRRHAIRSPDQFSVVKGRQDSASVITANTGWPLSRLRRTPCRWFRLPDLGRLERGLGLASVGVYGVGQPFRWPERRSRD